MGTYFNMYLVVAFLIDEKVYKLPILFELNPRAEAFL